MVHRLVPYRQLQNVTSLNVTYERSEFNTDYTLTSSLSTREVISKCCQVFFLRNHSECEAG